MAIKGTDCKSCVHENLQKCLNGQYHKLCVPKGCPNWDDSKLKCRLKVGDQCLRYEPKKKTAKKNVSEAVKNVGKEPEAETPKRNCVSCKHERKKCDELNCPLWVDDFECAGLGDLPQCGNWEPKAKPIRLTRIEPLDPLEERQTLAEELSKYDAVGGNKNDEGKAPFHLLPPRALFDVTEAYADGLEKYKAHNWLRGLKWSRYFAAAMRHLWAWWMGEDKAPDSGVHHLAHAAACILNLLEYQHGYQRFDDRPNACLKQLIEEAKGAEG